MGECERPAALGNERHPPRVGLRWAAAREVETGKGTLLASSELLMQAAPHSRIPAELSQGGSSGVLLASVVICVGFLLLAPNK